MSPTVSRRRLLRTAGLASVAAVAGCSSSSSTPKGGRSYGFVVKNQLKKSQFRSVDVDPRPATVHLVMEKVSAGTGNEPYYRKTVSVAPNSTKELKDQFEMPSDDSLYTITVSFEPMVENLPDRIEPDRSDGYTFKPGDYGTPEDRKWMYIVRIHDDSESPLLVPDVAVEP